MTDSREHNFGPPGTAQETYVRRHLNKSSMLIKESSKCRNGPECLSSSVLCVPVTISGTWHVVILVILFCVWSIKRWWYYFRLYSVIIRIMVEYLNGEDLKNVLATQILRMVGGSNWKILRIVGGSNWKNKERVQSDEYVLKHRSLWNTRLQQYRYVIVLGRDFLCSNLFT
jgi:hypothetical protein